MDFKKCAFHSNAITRNGFAQHAPRSRAYRLFLPSVSISLLTGLFLLFIAIPIRVNGINVHNKVSYATGPGGAAAISIITTNQPQVTKGIDYAEYKEHILLSWWQREINYNHNTWDYFANKFTTVRGERKIRWIIYSQRIIPPALTVIHNYIPWWSIMY